MRSVQDIVSTWGRVSAPTPSATPAAPKAEAQRFDEMIAKVAVTEPPQKKAANEPAVSSGNAYVPMDSNEAVEAFRCSLAPSTQAFMRAGPCFDETGAPLDVRGQKINPSGDLGGVDVPPPASEEQAVARKQLAESISSGNAYYIDDIRDAGFEPSGAAFSKWFREVKSAA